MKICTFTNETTVANQRMPIPKPSTPTFDNIEEWKHAVIGHGADEFLKEKEFKNLFPRGTVLSSIDTIRDTLKSIDLDGLSYINKSIIKKGIKNKVFRNGTIDGFTVAAIDGTKLFGSNKKCCEKCLTTYVKGKPHYYHSTAVMSLVGDVPNLVLDFEMYNPKVDAHSKDEGEINVAKRLLSRVVEDYKNLVDVVTYDALACNSKFINHCIEAGINAVVRVKKNNNNSLRNVKRITNTVKVKIKSKINAIGGLILLLYPLFSERIKK